MVGDLGADIGKKAASELSRGLLETAIDQLNFSPRSKNEPFKGEMKVGEELNLKAKISEKKIELLQRQFQAVKVEQKTVFDRETLETKQRIQQLVTQISQEVKNIQVQTAALSGDVKNITVQETVKKPGLYHLNFFEWVVSMLQDLKKEVVKSRTWLSAFNSKKSKKGYWAMFKKHGSSFAMSDERSLATAAG